MRNTILTFSLITFLFSHSIINLKAQTIVTDRPDQTEASSTVAAGSLQIESGVLVGFSNNKIQSVKQSLLPTTLFRYGITKGVEIRVLNQFERNKNQTTSLEQDGISDLEIGTKIQVLRKENINTEIAIMSHLIFPTGSEGFSQEKHGTISKLSISHAINNKIGIGYNAGYNTIGTGIGDLTYSLALGIVINDKVGIYLEPYGELTEIDNHMANFDAGITYLVRDNLQLDFSFGTGLNHNMNYISTGFSWNIKKKGAL